MKPTMNSPAISAAICGILLATLAPIHSEETKAPINTRWSIEVNLAGDDGLSAKLRETLLPGAPSLGGNPSLAVMGFDNPATADQDWLVSLEVPGHSEEIWKNLQHDHKDKWGSPDESGRWFIHDEESGDHFVIARADDALKFTNAAENFDITLESRAKRRDSGWSVHGHVMFGGKNEEQAESRLLRLAESVTFNAAGKDDGMQLEVTVAMIEAPPTGRIEKAVSDALDSRLLDRLKPVLPKPVLSHKSDNGRHNFTFNMQFDAGQTDRVIAAVIKHLTEGDPHKPQPQPAPETDDPDAKNR